MKRFSIFLMSTTALLVTQQLSFSQTDQTPAVEADQIDEPINVRNDHTLSLFDLKQHEVTYRDSIEEKEIGAILTGGYQPIALSSDYAMTNNGICCRTDCYAFWEHRDSIFGEYLYLTVRGANVPYATPVDGVALPQVPTGPVGVADPDYSGGFRIGASMALDPCSSFTFNYAFFESSHRSGFALPGGGMEVIRSDLAFTPINVAADSLSTSVNYDIDFDLLDANYKGLIWGGDCYSLNYLVGFRYGHTNQDLLANYLIVGATTVQTEIDFEGFGPHIGLEGERLIGRGMRVYFNTSANFLVGEFDADYAQNNIAAGQQAVTSYNDDRIVPVLELELGVGWQSRCGKYRLSTGYYVGAWFNSVTTPNFVDAVQRNDFITEMSDTLTFDGLTARAEIRF